MQRFKITAAAFCVFALTTRWASGADINEDAEKRSFLPLIPESYYTYAGAFKGHRDSNTLIVKTDRVGGADVYYFVLEKDMRNPEALIGAETFGLGLFLKTPAGIASVDCFSKSQIQRLSKAQLENAITLFKDPPEIGATVRADSVEKALAHTFRVEGFEDVTVPAGTFKDCLKIRTEEILQYVAPEKDSVTTGMVWLARGIGVVKWIRTTGRVDELTAYALKEQPKK